MRAFADFRVPSLRMIDFIDYPASSNLRRLLSVRSTLFVALTALIAFVDVDLPRAPLAVIVGTLAAVTFASWLRAVRLARPVRDAEVMAQLIVDVGALTALFYLTGGWTNPLVSLYLVPIAAAAAMLPSAMAWCVALAAMAGYAAIAVSFVPLPHAHGVDATFSTHVLGMGITFLLAAGLIAYLGTTMAASLRARAAALAHAREAILRNEQIIGVATLAAGTAHELSTPLSTIAVIASELRDSTIDHRRDVDVLLSQIEICKDILRRLRDEAAPHVDGADLQSIGAFVDGVAEQFQLLRPTAGIAFSQSGCEPQPLIRAEPTLKQAILNLLNNAADASPRSVDVAAKWTPDRVVIDILDRGAGFAVRGIETPFAAAPPNDSAEGMGVGLMLANATIERLGGAVHIADRSSGGAWVQVTLPLTAADAA
jgi:two-component system sensor histidine kinase RegB